MCEGSFAFCFYIHYNTCIKVSFLSFFSHCKYARRCACSLLVLPVEKSPQGFEGFRRLEAHICFDYDNNIHNCSYLLR